MVRFRVTSVLATCIISFSQESRLKGIEIIFKKFDVPAFLIFNLSNPSISLKCWKWTQKKVPGCRHF